MARLAQIVVDSRMPSKLARFWAAALDDFEIRAYDTAEIARLATLGRTPETDPTVLLDGPMLEMCFQEVEASTRSKRTLHLDIETADRALEVARLIKLGATTVAAFETHTWMRDPEGNDFCLTDGEVLPAATSRLCAICGVGRRWFQGVVAKGLLSGQVGGRNLALLRLGRPAGAGRRRAGGTGDGVG